MSLDFFNRKNKPLNIDITHRCPLECLRCGRQTSFRNKGKEVPGYDMLLSDFDKITDHFPKISFCGQYSDPIHHPQFIEILKMCARKNITAEVHVASSLKPMKFYLEAFAAYPNASWIFGIDGLPNESHTYRVNQDGEKLYNIMLESKKYLKKKPQWQYIIFSYNEDNVDTALEMAKRDGLDFLMINSARWSADNDWLKPKTRR